MAQDYPIDSHDNAAWALKVEEGLPVGEVVSFGKEIGFTSEQLAKLIRMPARTYARRVANKSRLKVDEGERAARLMRLYCQACQALGNAELAKAWLNRPLRVMGGRTPLDYARTEPGAREVEAVLLRYIDGVFS